MWFVDGRLPEDEQKMQAMCMKCSEKQQFGWFWQGSTIGYGDYDLSCSLCGDIIHQREEENADED